MNTRSLFGCATWHSSLFNGVGRAIVPLLVIAMPAFGRPDLSTIVFDPYPLDEVRATSLQDQHAENFISFGKFMPVSFGMPEADTFDFDQAIARSREQVNATIDKDGPYSEALEQQLQQLGRLYQDAGQHEQALDTYQQAIQLSKINFGLYHEDQIPLVESSIKSLLALGMHSQVNDQLEYLIYLHQKFYGPDSMEVIEPLANKVAWDMHFFKQSIQHNAGQGLTHDDLINGFASQSQWNSGMNGLLTATQKMIIKGIHILVNANDFSNPFLHQFEQQLIETYFYQMYHDEQNYHTKSYITNLDGSFLAQGPYDHTKANFDNGAEAYERLLAYLEKSHQQDTLEYVVATIGLGDWNLLYGKLEASREYYDAALALVEKGNFSDQDKQYLLHPAVPTPLPAFGDEARPSKARAGQVPDPGQYRGYVDLTFQVNRFGRVVNLETLGHSDSTPGYIVSELEWRLRDTQYRPQLAVVDTGAGDVMRLRYYYTY